MKEINKIKRLLCIVGGMNVGGAETFLMKIYRKLDREKYQMDFCVFSKEEGFYEKEIKELGGKIYHLPAKSDSFFKSLNEIRKLVKEKKAVYILRISQHSLSSLDLLAAKLGGAKILVFRSSNSNTCAGKISSCLHFLFRPFANIISNVKLAPSTEAAKFMFGNKRLEEVNLIKNAIPVEKFVFNKQKRDKIRKELNIENKFVIGHIGRLNFQKNHSFLIDIFKEVSNKDENAILLLVGKGELEERIKLKIKKLNLEDKVIFVGVREDVPELLMAMDVFVFPSFFEGMPNTVIEAQATDLPCLISKEITKEVRIGKNVEFLSLKVSVKKWSDKILSYKNKRLRKNKETIFMEKGYNIIEVTEKFVNRVFNGELENDYKKNNK